jgi:LNS2 (Lipin/Ned1/Smp2)/lipin, N-terminal conserved region/Lipin/Ned1/Smp2 multi-domain protein middle domain
VSRASQPTAVVPDNPQSLVLHGRMATYVGRLLTAVSSALEFNSATLSGAIDIIVIADERGRRHCSPFHIRFGKLQLLKSRGLPVSVELNGVSTNLRLYLGPAGEAYFYNPPPDAGEAVKPENEPPPVDGSLCDSSLSVSFSAAGASSVAANSEPLLGPSADPSASTSTLAPPGPLDPQRPPALYAQKISDPKSDSTSSPASPLFSAQQNYSRTASAPIPEKSIGADTAIASASLSSNSIEGASKLVDSLDVATPVSSHFSHLLVPQSAVVADDVCGYASDSEVEVSRHNRDGTAEVVDEPRSPPVSSVERTLLKRYARSRLLREQKSVLIATPPPPPHPTPQDSGQCLPASDNAQSDSRIIAPVAKVVLVPKLDADTLIMAREADVGVNDSIDKRSGEGEGAVSEPEATLILAADVETDAIVAEDMKLECRSLDGYDDYDDDVFRSGDDRVATHAVAPHDLSQALTDAIGLVSAKSVSRSAMSSATVSPSTGAAVEPALATGNVDDYEIAKPMATAALGAINVAEQDVNEEDATTLTMSLCADTLESEMSEYEIGRVFEAHRVSFSEFAANPNLLYDRNLLFCIDDRLVEFRIAAAFIMSSLAFGVPLDMDVLATRMSLPPASRFDSQTTPEPTGNAQEQHERSQSEGPGRTFGNWFTWSRPPAVVGEPLLSEEDLQSLEVLEPNDDENMAGTVGTQADVDAVKSAAATNMQDSTGSKSQQQIAVSLAAGGNSNEATAGLGDASVEMLELADGTAISLASATAKDRMTPDEALEATAAAETALAVEAAAASLADPFGDTNSEYLSLVPTADQLADLDLQSGANTIRFIVASSAVELSCRIFLWGPDVKIVISDVDGTITRSDVLGHLLPAMGRDWSHVGVAGLYTEIAKHGYKFMYLTARPIGQAAQTRGFLHNVTQSGARLPNGPCLMSPNRLVESFTREVIRRKPQEFKIAALREVRSLFPPDYNPFHAGFGNRETDVISYRAVGLIPQRIFVVNPQAELQVMNVRYESAASYSSLREMVDSVFPDIYGKIGREQVRNLTESAKFNSWNYWKPELPDLDLDALLKKGSE